MLCNWCSSEQLCKEWSTMCNEWFTCGNIEMTWEDKNEKTVQFTKTIQLQRWYKKRDCLLYTSPSPRDGLLARMPSSA